MNGKFTLEEIREYWKQQALKHGQLPAVSWSDCAAIEMEIRQIVKYLEDGETILDVGCGNGYSTVQYAARKLGTIKGIDFIPEMITQANLKAKELSGKLLGKIEFKVGDITALDESADSYDKVIVVRVLINLREWERQFKALQECIRVLKPGGMLLLSEATLQGWTKLNRFRNEWGLADIPMPSFNQYLDQKKVVEAVSPGLSLISVIDFSSTYYIGTRVLKPLLIKVLGIKVDAADPNMEWNRWFAQLPSWGDYGTQKLFIFKKVCLQREQV
ncbi:MAG: class I SAM-dependent methyltransferase [Candidatus Omnitrophota bacterium]|jgi:ubiquinone/menaquinone biosynthesis C-methylase UbiE